MIKRWAELDSKATDGPWERDVRDTSHFETTYATMMGPDGKSLFGTENSEVMQIESDSDEDGERYWDETGKRNLDLVAFLRNNSAGLRRVVEAAKNVNALSIQSDSHKELRKALAELESK